MALWLGLLTIFVVVLFLQLRKVRRDLQRTTAQFNALAAYVRDHLVPENQTDAPPRPVALDAAPEALQIEGPASDTPAPAAPSPWEKTGAPATPPAEAKDEGEDASVPKAVVFRQDRFAGLFAWLKANSFYAISALSLALAGIFLVQYSVSNGLLPPYLRVLLGLAFGGAFILLGEVIRRRFGDGEQSATAYLPSIFSGVGIVTLFAAFGAGHLLYGLIPPTFTLLGLIAVSILSIVLGWLHGPLLASIGLLGAFAAPFIAGGSGDASLLYIHFAALAAVALFIDALRRWAWISVLGLFLAITGGAMAALSGTVAGLFTVFMALLAALSIGVPPLNLRPAHKGPMVLESALAIRVGGARWPQFPTRLAAGTVWAMAVLVPLLDLPNASSVWVAFPVLALLMVALILWCEEARALSDLSLPLAGSFLLCLVLPAFFITPLYQIYRGAEGGLATATPGFLSAIALFSVPVTLAAAWRSGRDQSYPVIWAALAAGFSPVVLILAELFWKPALVQGTWDWALHAIFLAALMTFLAERFWRADEMENRQRTALAALSALSLIAFAFFVLLTEGPLTLALAVMIVVAAALDRHFGLRLLSLYICAGVAALGYRLIVDPGVPWAQTAPVVMVILTFAGVIGGFVAARYLLANRHRPATQILLISAAWATSGVFLTVLLYRIVVASAGPNAMESHWGYSLTGAIWFIVAMTQVYRLSIQDRLQRLRLAFAIVAGVLAFYAFGMGLIVHAPLLNASERVIGPYVFNTLFVAYLHPAVLLFVATRMNEMTRAMRLGGLIAAGVLVMAYVLLEVRHIWRGDNLALPGTVPGELYTYTLILLLIGAALLIAALLRRSYPLRIAGLVVIGLAVAKVFLIDISGLGGLIRVFSFLALGLALAGLAWLNRWIGLMIAGEEYDDEEYEDDDEFDDEDPEADFAEIDPEDEDPSGEDDPEAK